MEVFDVEHQETHGGSMRYYIGHKDIRPLTERAYKQTLFEDNLKLNSKSTYENFKADCEKSKKDLKELLINLKKQGKRVVGYGATSKSTTILNYSDIGPDLIEYICDNTPIKQNKFSPGKHIPIVSIEKFKNDDPDYILLFAYNHAKEIMEKEQDYTDRGGKWILYVPNLQII
tara:strand:- start:265 stop:783 length:519 start_codon:yes stop_codon:yes gene_type:complete